MFFLFNNSNMSEASFKRVAEQYCDPTVKPSDDAVQSAAKAITRSQLEVWALANRRARAALAFPSRLAECRRPEDFANAYLNFWKTAFTEYADTTHRVAGLMSPTAGAVTTPVAEQKGHVVSRLEKSVAASRKLNGAHSGRAEELRQAS